MLENTYIIVKDSWTEKVLREDFTFPRENSLDTRIFELYIDVLSNYDIPVNIITWNEFNQMDNLNGTDLIIIGHRELTGQPEKVLWGTPRHISQNIDKGVNFLFTYGYTNLLWHLIDRKDLYLDYRTTQRGKRGPRYEDTDETQLKLVTKTSPLTEGLQEKIRMLNSRIFTDNFTFITSSGSNKFSSLVVKNSMTKRLGSSISFGFQKFSNDNYFFLVDINRVCEVPQKEEYFKQAFSNILSFYQGNN